jgi:hypothetical protein
MLESKNWLSLTFCHDCILAREPPGPTLPELSMGSAASWSPRLSSDYVVSAPSRIDFLPTMS